MLTKTDYNKARRDEYFSYVRSYIPEEKQSQYLNYYGSSDSNNIMLSLIDMGKFDSFIPLIDTFPKKNFLDKQILERKNLQFGNRLSIMPVGEPTAGEILLSMREAGISIGDPTAKDWVLNQFPSISDEIKSQDKILDYEQSNNLIKVTPSPNFANNNLKPIILLVGVGVLLYSLSSK